ncbi:MAG: alkaline phosphatase family protein [Clostridia bacterium]|nr:alkaline phosphatase family protein [Clostridia bacterium]
MKNFILPDYTNSNLNISATVAEYLGAPNKNATLPILADELGRDYKNIVFICFDGMGTYPLGANPDESAFLRENTQQTLVSTFPSTTTNATTSLLTNRLPIEHGWFGWTLHFKDLGRNIDIFKAKDSVTGEAITEEYIPSRATEYYFYHTDGRYNINTVFPEYVEIAHPEVNTVFDTLDEMFESIKSICEKDGKQFIYAYYPDPDTTMHVHGIDSDEAKAVIRSISDGLEALSHTDDTLFIVTADHGQSPVEDYADLCGDEKLMDMLEVHPFLEPRAPAFIVKDEAKAKFEDYFTEKYGEGFLLRRSADLVREGFFGDPAYSAGFEDLLGDYIAIGTYAHVQAILNPNKRRYFGHHTSLTEEMEVPLIMFGKKSAAGD